MLGSRSMLGVQAGPASLPPAQPLLNHVQASLADSISQANETFARLSDLKDRLFGASPTGQTQGNSAASAPIGHADSIRALLAVLNGRLLEIDSLAGSIASGL